jgi:hypothetical protein
MQPLASADVRGTNEERTLVLQRGRQEINDLATERGYYARIGSGNIVPDQHRFFVELQLSGFAVGRCGNAEDEHENGRREP